MKNFFLFMMLFIYTDTALANDTMDTLLNRAAQGIRSTHSLDAVFQQEKLIPFLDVSLKAEGKFCFHIPQKGSPYIFWEYRSPSISGFQYKNYTIRLWSGSSQENLPSVEKGFLNAMVEQILQWIMFDRMALNKDYSLSLITGKDHVIVLTPHKPSHIFKKIELEFSQNFTTLSSIHMTGHQNDVTILDFLPQSINATLSDDCQK